ncbi:AUGMIN subunit 3 [Vitis vinifera]|uniref:AUGMIN subunit 3 n=2 Tax=Vitis vinifera TaxID=29760 RepID=A0A438DFU7_VITVI|nr:AUGMIN subunit 3 [Vitis vinifera]CAN79112.1 hypothetical protein VITISV_021342 [Vitis vinifera]
MSGARLCALLGELGYEGAEALDPDSFEWPFQYEDARPILDWICSSLRSSNVLSLSEMMELGNQLVVEGRGWDKIARLKEGLPGGALGEGSRLLKMMLKDGSLLEFPQNFEAISLCKDIVASFGESDTSKIKSSSCSMGEVLPSENLFDKLTRFSSFLRMPVVGFENEIMSLLRKVDTRRGTEDKACCAVGGLQGD